MRYLALFILGFLLGAGLTNLLLAHQQDKLYLSKTELEQQLTAAKEEIAQLKESLGQENYQVVVAIEPIITFKDDKSSDIETRTASQTINSKIQEFLAPLKGQEVRHLNPALIPAMLDGRTVKVNGQEYRIKVTLLLISEKVIVHIEARNASIPNR